MAYTNENAVMKVDFPQFINEIKDASRGLIVADSSGTLTLHVRHGNGWFTQYESPDYLDVSHLEYMRFLDVIHDLIYNTSVGQNVCVLNSRL